MRLCVFSSPFKINVSGSGNGTIQSALPTRTQSSRLRGYFLTEISCQDDERGGQEVRGRMCHLLEVWKVSFKRLFISLTVCWSISKLCDWTVLSLYFFCVSLFVDGQWRRVLLSCSVERATNCKANCGSVASTPFVVIFLRTNLFHENACGDRFRRM